MEITVEVVDGIASSARDHPDWTYSGGDEGYDREVNRLAEAYPEESPFEGSIPSSEMYFEHDETGSTLYLLFEDVGYARAEVHQPIDHRIGYGSSDFEKDEEGFVGDLLRTYDRVSGKHGTVYTNGPIDDNLIDVETAEIPFDYDVEELDATLDSMSEVSKEVEDIHEAIRQPVRDKPE